MKLKSALIALHFFFSSFQLRGISVMGVVSRTTQLLILEVKKRGYITLICKLWIHLLCFYNS